MVAVVYIGGEGASTLRANLLLTLNHAAADYHYAPSLNCPKLQIFTRFPNEFLSPVWESDRLTVRQLKTPSMAQDILVAAIHLPSKVNWEEADQAAESPFYSDWIKQAEKQVGHQRTIVIGDFNMNPYEKGMVNASGFNAAMSRSIAMNRKRVLQGLHYPFFYNPMWSLMGDLSPGSPFSEQGRRRRFRVSGTRQTTLPSGRPSPLLCYTVAPCPINFALLVRRFQTKADPRRHVKQTN